MEWSKNVQKEYVYFSLFLNPYNRCFILKNWFRLENTSIDTSVVFTKGFDGTGDANKKSDQNQKL